jgi:Cytochrome P460
MHANWERDMHCEVPRTIGWGLATAGVLVGAMVLSGQNKAQAQKGGGIERTRDNPFEEAPPRTTTSPPYWEWTNPFKASADSRRASGCTGNSPSWSQASASSATNLPRETRPPTPDEFQQSFWRFIVRQEAPYNRWKSWAEAVSDREVQSPHGGKARVYANKAAAESQAFPPHGSILVREDFDEKEKRTAISVMYRFKGTDPAHNDWYWLRYTENGAIVKAPAEEGGKPMAGKVASCIECHGKAAGEDWVFANDLPPKAPQ